MHNPFSTKLIVQRYRWTKYDRIDYKGSGYCRDQGEYQLLKKQFFFFGFPFFSLTLDREEIPSWAWIDLCCYGSTDWKSKFQEYI